MQIESRGIKAASKPKRLSDFECAVSTTEGNIIEKPGGNLPSVQCLNWESGRRSEDAIEILIKDMNHFHSF